MDNFSYIPRLESEEVAIPTTVEEVMRLKEELLQEFLTQDSELNEILACIISDQAEARRSQNRDKYWNNMFGLED